MSREIKLRVRDSDTKEILGYEYFNTSLNNGYYYIDLDEPLEDEDGGVDYNCKTEFSERPMLKPKSPLGRLLREQFTGLTDKHGVEIWEGDILETPYEYSANEYVLESEDDEGMYRGLVHYTPSKGFIQRRVIEKSDNEYKPKWRKRKSLEIRQSYCVVIGNIHQNPELLEA